MSDRQDESGEVTSDPFNAFRQSIVWTLWGVLSWLYPIYADLESVGQFISRIVAVLLFAMGVLVASQDIKATGRWNKFVTTLGQATLFIFFIGMIHAGSVWLDDYSVLSNALKLIALILAGITIMIVVAALPAGLNESTREANGQEDKGRGRVSIDPVSKPDRFDVTVGVCNAVASVTGLIGALIALLS